MTNTTDFFEPEYENLALPAATTMVFLDGTLCDDLEPVEIVRDHWPQFGSARLACNPAAQQTPQPISLEPIDDRFGMGRSICLRRGFNAGPPDTVTAGLPVFAGRIEGIEATLGPNGQTIEILARDFSATLERVTIYGRHIAGGNGSTSFLGGLDTTFNPAGQGNAAPQTVTVDGKTYTPFCADAAQARPWTCAEVIRYLLSSSLPDGLLQIPDLDQLGALTEHRVVRDLDVTGLSLLEALRRCCDSDGLRFRFVPRFAETGPDEAMEFYRPESGPTVELNVQPVGTPLNLSRTNVAALQTHRPFAPITHRTIGQGDFKVYEATFDLVAAWDPAREDTDYTLFSASTNPEFHAVKDVYRKWCLNEAGDYTAAPFNQGDAFDLTPIFAGAGYVLRRRRFWPALSTDPHGRSLDYFLEVSFNAGLHWRQYTGAFNNLLDECGLWLSGDRLDVETWVAALKGTLRFRITASVVSDERLTCIIADGPVGSTTPVVDRVLTLPRRFRYRRVSPHSVLAQAGAGTCGPPNEADDATALYECVRRHAAASAATMETAQVRTPTLLLDLHPGDTVISAPQSRDLFNARRDNRSRISIERVQIDFKQQCTRLSLVRQRR